MAISTGRQVVRAWLAITVIFELIAIARIYVLGHPLKEVLPLHGADGPAHFVRYWAFVAALLAVIRLGTILHIESKASWFTTAATHVLELCVYTYWVVTDGVLPTDPSQIKAAHAPGLFIWGTILGNALIFSYFYFNTPSSKPAAATAAAATAGGAPARTASGGGGRPKQS